MRVKIEIFKMADVAAGNISNNAINGNQGSPEYWIAFYFSVAICVLIGIVGIVGNGLVLYVSRLKKDFGKFKYVNKVVTNLALSDFLYGVIGIPCTMIFWIWGMFLH